MKEIIMFILASWVLASLSVIWMLGIVAIARLYFEIGRFIFEFKFKKKKEGRKVND